MRCPECSLENESHVTQCVECGADLTQARLMESTPHRTNQVWNTDIDADRNRKNSRTALGVLGVTILLLIALVVCVALYLPKVMSFSMDGMDFSLPEINLSELLDNLRQPERISVETRPAPEPDYLPGAIGDAELDFLNALTAYAIELSYAEDTDREREIHQIFYPDFEHLLSQKFSNDNLYDYAWWMMDQVKILRTYGIDRMAYNQALYDLSTVVLTLNEGHDLLSDFPDVVEYYSNAQLRAGVLLEVDTDVYGQLVGMEAAVWSEEHNCDVLYYTNSTPYTLDLQFIVEFETEDTHYSDSENFMELQPEAVAAIPVRALSKLRDQEHSWRISWEILEVYMDDMPVIEYYN